ncbi:MAG: sodium-translocating pyrophosphatase [Oscillospiraceae bacterium]|nr:sodium-translocating pyrophosphatase [Oscillospiraceae bacterium]
MDIKDLLFFLVPVASIAALIFAIAKAAGIMKQPEGTDQMIKIAGNIRKGASAYLKRQYSGVALFFLVMLILLGVMAYGDNLGFLQTGLISDFVPFAFLTGGFFSGLSGFFGMKIATHANSRTANACRTSLNKGLKVAFSAGSVMGFTVVGLGLLDISIWYLLLKYAFGLGLQETTACMITFGMGASSMALFARVGGGIFTKAADVGADLVGKVEAGIPEDDPRNPAVIADNVGDNVGDVAGMGADLYESYVGSIISSMALAVSAFMSVPDLQMGGVVLPLIIAVVGVLLSMIGTVLVRTGEKTEQKQLLKALRRGTNFSAIVIAIAAFFLVWFLLGWQNIGFYFSILSGLLAGVLIGFYTEYATSDSYKPTKKLADTSKTGPATIIIGGIALGMNSVFVPVVVIGVAVLAAFTFGGGFFSAIPGVPAASSGLYGIALAAVGMLSTLGITLATDAYGPVADNAGGIAEMAGLEAEVRERTDALDSLGNTTAATGKGFAIGSAALTALALIAAYTDRIKELIASANNLDFSTQLEKVEEIFDKTFNLSVMNPTVLVGLFIGAMLPFIFAAFTMNSVGRAAQAIVVEVRRQFKEITGLMEGTAEADYARCVTLCTKSAQKEMIIPSLLAIIAPVATGLLLGVEGVVGLLAGATATGFLLAIFMANAGGAWDNAKKYIEAGNLGGKGGSNHKAAVVGDTVGDPFKDTSGPSINILIKLLSMVSIVFAGLVLAFNAIDLVKDFYIK